MAGLNDCVQSLVFDHLLKVDKNLAQIYQKKVKAVSASRLFTPRGGTLHAASPIMCVFRIRYIFRHSARFSFDY